MCRFPREKFIDMPRAPAQADTICAKAIEVITRLILPLKKHENLGNAKKAEAKLPTFLWHFGSLGPAFLL